MDAVCLNPVCSNTIESIPISEGWRRTPKRFCSDDCKMNAWVLRRASELLASLPVERKLAILGGGFSEITMKSLSGSNGQINRESK